ncbi:MAG: hypothetical protein ACI4JB_10465 [Porcipelethomonas sp.]
MKKLVGILATLAMSVTCLTACGGEGDFVGKWECTEMTYGGETIEGDYMGVPVGSMFQVEFKDDNTGSIMVVGEDAATFDWKADGDTVTITADGEDVEITKDGDQLVAKEGEGDDETSFKLKKVDEFSEFNLDELMGELGE